MKILAIRGKNLASLEGKFEVDFNAEPLKSSGLFAITGDTGSGKSTLLDALCLAMFGTTPRIKNSVESADVADVGDGKIKQNDPRNILRRGAFEGYAEVNFLALSGVEYRARWSVRRARDRSDGKLQGATQQLFNCATNEELSGGKRELNDKVSELIGLTFDQFTRSVLLAQGDFATFIKARQSDKAELLEKLTGTDIYSRISIRIYENMVAAQGRCIRLQEQIDGVGLLSDEELAALSAEQGTIASKEQRLAAELKSIDAKLRWTAEKKRYDADLKKAQGTLDLSERLLAEAAPRIEKLKRIDIVQSIRDSYKRLEADSCELAAAEPKLLSLGESRRAEGELLDGANVKLNEAQDVKLTLDDEWNSVEPDLRIARELDVQLDAKRKEQSVAQGEVDGVANDGARLQGEVDSYEKKVAEAKKGLAKIDEWNKKHQCYAKVVEQAIFVGPQIAGLKSAEQGVAAGKKLCDKLQKDIAKGEEELAKLRAEEGELKLKMPAEIAELRKELKVGEPCAVCGSTEHPLAGEIIDSLEDKVLKESQERVARDIERLTTELAEKRDGVVTANANVENQKDQKGRFFEVLKQLMADVPNWQVLLEGGTLQSHISTIVDEWGRNEKRGADLLKDIELNEQAKKMATDALAECKSSGEERAKALGVVVVDLQKLVDGRAAILNGKSTDDVEADFKSRQKSADALLSAATKLRDDSVAKVAKVDGEIVQLKARVEALRLSVEGLSVEVRLWVESNGEGISSSELRDLLSLEEVDVATERATLDGLSNNGVAARSAYKECKRRSDEHEKAEGRFAESDNENVLKQYLDDKTAERGATQRRSAEVIVALDNHAKGLESVAELSCKMAEESGVKSDWESLNSLFGSARGDKFKVLAQGYTLEVLLGYANDHLAKISDRYLLQRNSSSPDSLSLMVVDRNMFDEVRSVESLSGGETFLVSLALALGLSSLSSSNMSVESLFIDEGFGSLDSETLSDAMDALESLHMHGGRKIGVISHVTDMVSRIGTQIRVVKQNNGRSSISVVAGA